MINPLDKKIIDDIITLIQQERENNNITNEIVRDDVFSLLDRHCQILYYPLENENINGYHISLYDKNEYKDFVFINTANTTEKQVFAAAHELGHILKVDEKICTKHNLDITEYGEKIVNRFAAELLMPKTIFQQKINIYLRNLKKDKISVSDILIMTVYLMNEFLVEYKAIILRYYELGNIDEETKNVFFVELMKETNLDSILKEIAQTANYTRLFIESNKKSMSKLMENLKLAHEKDIVTDEYIKKIKKRFDVDDKRDTTTDKKRIMQTEISFVE